MRCVTSDFTVIEVTDVDFMTNNINTVQSMQIGSSSGASDNRSDIDLIVEDVDFIEPATLIPTPITPVNLNPGMSAAIDNTQDRRTRVEDAPDDEDEALIEPILEEVPKKTKSGRTSKKSKK
ncbi:hypothetical protein C2G38_2236693 [Gigaspora rosea]|uniref:Uncharacterized protein n=1 Tax=Gigaspora rosea TaxID=44941 RepID=A0A397TYI3_9GLOM|nr:hypothetical protein C2G38_2236693 [Gigaspora rosea]